MLTKRTNILFDNDLWNLLTSIAKQEKSSVGEVVRRAVSKIYRADDFMARKKRAFETIKKYRVKVSGELDYKALVNEGRKF